MPSACFKCVVNGSVDKYWGAETKNIKNRSPSAKNQSSEIRLSESANKKIPESLLYG